MGKRCLGCNREHVPHEESCSTSALKKEVERLTEERDEAREYQIVLEKRCDERVLELIADLARVTEERDEARKKVKTLEFRLYWLEVPDAGGLVATYEKKLDESDGEHVPRYYLADAVADLKQALGEKGKAEADRDEWKRRAEAAERERDEALRQAEKAMGIPEAKPTKEE